MEENVSTLIQHRPDFQTDIRRDSKNFLQILPNATGEKPPNRGELSDSRINGIYWVI